MAQKVRRAKAPQRALAQIERSAMAEFDKLLSMAMNSMGQIIRDSDPNPNSFEMIGSRSHEAGLKKGTDDPLADQPLGLTDGPSQAEKDQATKEVQAARQRRDEAYGRALAWGRGITDREEDAERYAKREPLFKTATAVLAQAEERLDNLQGHGIMGYDLLSHTASLRRHDP